MGTPLQRRHFLAALLAATLTPARAATPNRTYRLGFIDIGDADTFFGARRKELLQALAELGYAQGRNLELVECYEKESPEKLFACGRKLADARVDAIVTEGTTSTLAVQKATRTIPVVTTVGDPVTAGFAKSLRHPGGNITGISQGRDDLARKQVEMLRIMRPRLAAIALLWEPPFPGVEILMRPVVDAAREASIATHEIPRGPNDLASSFAKMKQLNVDAAFVFGGLEPRQFQDAVRARVAIVASAWEHTESGALFSIQPDDSDSHLIAATLVDKILRGQSPAEMPFQSATRFITVINGKTAAALGIKITPELRLQAARIVE